MLSSTQLQLCASALAYKADAIEAGGDTPAYRSAQPYRIAANDAQLEVHAASGFANPATLALRIVIDNDRTMAEHLRALALQTIESAAVHEACAELADYPGLPAADQRASVEVSHIADALRDYLRDDVRERVIETASIRTIYGDDPDVAPTHKLRMAGVGIIAAMASYALSEVDWIEVAHEYRGRALKLGEHAEA